VVNIFRDTKIDDMTSQLISYSYINVISTSIGVDYSDSYHIVMMECQDKNQSE